MAIHTVTREIAGRTLTLETGRLANQAGGAVVVRYGDTMTLSAVTMAAPRAGIDFFPLTVDYREQRSAAGKFPGGFFKREGRPADRETLISRCIDRPLRPLFP
ncbi:MAG TPA: polyribonucleotide nucleotidyltransferase, partial [bacterium]|nr:polyribonucleotide nucleotidyltransferase [bacterium]